MHFLHLVRTECKNVSDLTKTGRVSVVFHVRLVALAALNMHRLHRSFLECYIPNNKLYFFITVAIKYRQFNLFLILIS